MRIYLAARYSRHTEMHGVATKLEALGHSITSRWTLGNHQCNDDQLTLQPEIGVRFAQEDIEDIAQADTLVLFTDPVRTPTRGGKQVELGIALATRMRVIIVGLPENVFQLLPQVEHVLNVEALYELLAPNPTKLGYSPVPSYPKSREYPYVY